MKLIEKYKSLPEWSRWILCWPVSFIISIVVSWAFLFVSWDYIPVFLVKILHPPICQAVFLWCIYVTVPRAKLLILTIFIILRSSVLVFFIISAAATMLDVKEIVTFDMGFWRAMIGEIAVLCVSIILWIHIREMCSVEHYLNLGFTHFAEGRLDKAISNFTKAIEIDPRSEIAYTERGHVYVEECQYDEAIEDYTNAIQINTRIAEAYYNRGNTYRMIDQNDLAISDLNKAIEIDPMSAEAYFYRGLFHLDSNQYDKAISDYSKSIEINPEYTDSYHGRASAYDKQGKNEEALSDYTKVIEIDPSYAAYHIRGDFYVKQELYDQAILDYNKAIEIGAKMGLSADYVYNKRSVAYYHKRDYNKAWKDVHKVLSLGSKVAPEFLKQLCEASESRSQALHAEFSSNDFGDNMGFSHRFDDI